MTVFTDFPETSYLRIFQSPRRFETAEIALITRRMDDFAAQWRAHEQPMKGAWEIRHDQFLVVGVDESVGGLSGCSKDSLVQAVRALSEELGVDLVHGPPLFFQRADGEVVGVDRAKFGTLVDEGKIDGDTTVFDATISTVGPYVQGRWEIPAAECWHARAWNLPTRA